MRTGKLYGKRVAACMLVAGLVVGNVPSIYASEAKFYIREVEYTESKLHEGDSFNILVSFSASETTDEEVSIKVSGEAANTEDMYYDFYVSGTDILKEGTIGLGELVDVEIRGLEYTGDGDEVTVEIGSDAYTINLDTLSGEDVKGALLLDQNAESNMSIEMNAGESKKASLTIKNTTSETIKNSIVRVSFDETTPGLAITDGQYIEISSISAGNTKEVDFVIETSDTLASGTYPINVEINDVEQTIYLEVGNDLLPPVIDLSYASNQVFAIGETKDLALTISNKGDTDAQNVKIALQSKVGVGLNGSSSTLTLGNIKAGEDDVVNLPIILTSDLTEDLVNIEFVVSYETKQGEQIEETHQLYLQTNEASDAEVTIKNIIAPTASYNVNEKFSISFDVVSDQDADAVKVSIITPEGIVPTSQNIFMVKDLEANVAKTHTVEMMATSETETSYYPVEIAVEYTYGDEIVTETQYSGISIIGEEEEDEDEEDDTIINPKVIVSNYTLSNDNLKPGDTATLNVGLLNTHGTETVENLTVTYTIDGEDGIFVPTQSGNTLYTSSIAPGKNTSQSFGFKILPNVAEADYVMQLTMDYENTEGDSFTSTQTIIVPVTNEGAITIGDLSHVTLESGRANALTIPLYNRGASTLENIMITLQGEGFTAQDNELYISSFTQGSTEYYLPSVTLTSNNPTIELVAEYENSNGELITVVYPLDLTMESSQNATSGNAGMTGGMPSGNTQTSEGMTGSKGDRTAMMGGMENMQAEQTSAAFPTWVYGVIGVITLVGGGLILKALKKRKTLKEMTIDEKL